MRLKLLLAYLGTGYSGWQIQEKPSPPPTIQGELEAALRVLAGTPVRAHASGRTDAGVHAHGQVAHCDVPAAKAGLPWRRSLNALLPPAIRVLTVEPAPPDFHARKDALRKTYVYQFWQERGFVPPQLTPFVWNCGPLDVQSMRAALPHLLGEQDFAGLQNAGTDMESTTRHVIAAALDIAPPCEFYPPHAPMLRLSVTANGFLWRPAVSAKFIPTAFRHCWRPATARPCPRSRLRPEDWRWPAWNTPERTACSPSKTQKPPG